MAAVTICSDFGAHKTTAGKNPSEEMEWPSWSTKESEMQYLDAVSKTTE